MSTSLNNLEHQCEERRLLKNLAFGTLGPCKECGTNIQTYLATHDEIIQKRPEWNQGVYWAACSNIYCNNNYGIPYSNFQEAKKQICL
jgi:hypothetical protein